MILAITFFIASLDSVPCFVWAFIWQFVTWPYTYTYPCYHMTICIHLPMLSHDDIPTPTHVITWPYTYTYPCYHMTIYLHLPMLSHDHIPTPTHVITWPYTYTYPCFNNKHPQRKELYFIWWQPFIYHYVKWTLHFDAF
jgi:hypothetical protein